VVTPGGGNDGSAFAVKRFIRFGVFATNVRPRCLVLALMLNIAAMRVLEAQAQTQTAGGPNSPTPAEASQRLPLDPLVPQEKAIAERIARTDKRVMELVGEAGVRVVSVELLALKPESLATAQEMPRRAEVMLFQPEREVGAKIAVNLQRGTVEQVERLSSREVPMTQQDLSDAFQLALGEPELQKILPELPSYHVQTANESQVLVAAQNMVTGLPIRGTKPNDPCTKHRCMQLFFKRGRDYLSEASVIVDLSAKHVYVERKRSR